MLNGNRKLKLRSRDSKITNHKNNLLNENYQQMDMKNKPKLRPNTKDIFSRKNDQPFNFNKENQNNSNRGKSKNNVKRNNERMNVKVDINININYNNKPKHLKKENFSGKKRIKNNLKIIKDNSNDKKQKIFLKKNIFEKENPLNIAQNFENKNDINNNTLDTNFSRSLKPSHNKGIEEEDKIGIKFYNIFGKNDNDNQNLPNIRQNSFKKGNINLNLLKIHPKNQLNQKQNQNYNDENIINNPKISNVNNGNIIKIKKKNNLINNRYEHFDKNNYQFPKLNIVGNNKKLKLLNNFLRPGSPEIENKAKKNNIIKLKEKKPVAEKRVSKSSANGKIVMNQKKIENNLINKDFSENQPTPKLNKIIELKEEETIKPDNNINKIYVNNTPNQIEKTTIEYFYKEDINKYDKMEDFTLVKSPFFQKLGHNMSLFAVFDGHGGKEVAEYLSKNFNSQLLEEILKNSNKTFPEILKQTVLDIDEKIKTLKNADKTGSTGTIVVIDNNKIYCANVGDSKCYYINNEKSEQLTEDHNCKNQKEVAFVKKSGGLVFQGRVFGALMLTRSFGDVDYKDCGVTAIPYIVKINKEEKNVKFIVLASDGIWDVVDDKQLYKISLENGGSAKEFCEKLVKYSLENHSQDNISCIVIKV